MHVHAELASLITESHPLTIRSSVVCPLTCMPFFYSACLLVYVFNNHNNIISLSGNFLQWKTRGNTVHRIEFTKTFLMYSKFSTLSTAFC